MKIRVKYFAFLRQQSGIGEEEIDIQPMAASELYAQLKNKYSFKLPQEQLRVAINDEFSEFDQVLNENDKVVFIPPVAGG